MKYINICGSCLCVSSAPFGLLGFVGFFPPRILFFSDYAEVVAAQELFIEAEMHNGWDSWQSAGQGYKTNQKV